MDEINVQNAANEAAIPSEPETQQEVLEVNEPATEPQEQETDNNATAQPPEEEIANSAEEKPFLVIKHLKEMVPLSWEEAKNYAEIGKHFSGVRQQLERIATLKGQTVDEFLNGIETAQDEAYRQGLVDKFGNDEDTVNKMMELYQINKQKTLDAAALKRQEESVQAEQSVNERLATEFTDMKNGDFPELTDFASLPNEVKRAAMDGMSLSHAYLAFMHRENKKIAAQKASEEAAAKKSTGSMATAEETVDAVSSALLKGLWNR